MKKVVSLILLAFTVSVAHGQEVDSLQMYFDKIEASLKFEKGKINLPGGIGIVNVPPGFEYLNSENAELVLHNLWGNPEGNETLGLLVPEGVRVTDPASYAFILTYEEMGYVKDDDADDIDYTELLTEMQTDMEAENQERVNLGYEPIALVGWAETPFYDPEKHVLHWAKELRFGESEHNTLNYNIRILGRKGVVVLNAVASMEQLPAVKENITPMLSAFQYTDGNHYGDFNPDVDEVAAWTIGGLVAGKVLAKAGIFALLLKNIKLIGLALVGLFGGLWKWYRKKTELPTVRNISGTDQSDS